MTKQLAHNDFLFVTGEQADGRDGRGVWIVGVYDGRKGCLGGWGDVGKVSLGRSEKWGWHKKSLLKSLVWFHVCLQSIW